MKKPKKVLVVLNLGRQSVPQKIAMGKHYVEQMTGNAHFATPNPTLAAVTAKIDELARAHSAALNRTTGYAEHMHIIETEYEIIIKALAGYVEKIANDDSKNAVVIIKSAGMEVKKTSIRVVHDFSVKIGKNPGEVLLSVKKVPRATYDFEMSTDPGNPASWVSIFKNSKSRFKKTGLTSGTRYYFRVSYVDKHGQSPVSPVLSTVVL